MSNTKVALGEFITRHKEHVGHPYMVNWGKDSAIMKRVVDTYGMLKTNLLINKFFVDAPDNEFILRAGITVGIFKTQIPRLLMSMNIEDKKKVEEDNVGRL